MNDWPKVRLGEICEIYDCPHTTAPDEGEGYPLVRTPNVGRGRLIFDKMHRVSRDVYDRRNKRAVPKAGDIIFAREAPAGNAALITDGQLVCLGQRTVLIRPNNKITDSAYLTYCIISPKVQERLLGISHGSTVSHVNMPDIVNLEVPLPPLSTQCAIGKELNQYDDLIENNTKRIAILERMAEQLYKEWFVRRRFPGHEKTKWINGLPEGWRKGKIHEVVKISDEKRIPLSVMERDKQKKIYPYFGAAELMDYVESYIFNGIYLLMGEDGSVITPDGYPVLQLVDGKFWVNNHAHVLQGDNGFSTEFLYLTLKRMNISGIVTGSAQPKISQGRLLNWRIVIPAKMLVEKASKCIKPIFGMIRNLQRQNALLAKERDLLLPRLMSGRLSCAAHERAPIKEEAAE